MNGIELKFDGRGLIPAIVRDNATGAVLMMAWMNADTLRLTRETGYTHFWSRSRGETWKKGDTSGNVQKVEKIQYDCDLDTLLISVTPAGPACHTGAATCFFTELKKDDAVKEPPPPADERVIERLYQIIQQRRTERPEGSYVAKLFDKGENTILKKIGEEGVEFVMACQKKDAKEAVYEAADLWFHMLVALANIGIAPDAVFEELKRRFK